MIHVSFIRPQFGANYTCGKNNEGGPTIDRSNNAYLGF